jgi:hypothetical protein
MEERRWFVARRCHYYLSLPPSLSNYVATGSVPQVVVRGTWYVIRDTVIPVTGTVVVCRRLVLIFDTCTGS